MVFAPLCDSIPARSGGGGGEKKVQPPLNFKAPLLLLLQFTEAASLGGTLKIYKTMLFYNTWASGGETKKLAKEELKPREFCPCPGMHVRYTVRAGA